jgi:hypothetical protein
MFPQGGNMKKHFIILMSVVLGTALASGCAIAGVSSPNSTPPLQAGTLEIRVTDAPRADNVSAINVTVSEVEIHKATPDQDGDQEGDNDGEWISLNITAPTFELLALKDGGIQQVLTSVDNMSGKYTQIRMTVDNVTVRLGDGDNITAKLPSGKLKFVQPFEVIDWNTTVLLFDFDAEKSVKVNYTGPDREPQIIVTPVVKLTVEKPRPTAAAVKITTDRNLPNGTDNVSYTATLTATGGTPPYTWIKLSGDWPTGLTLHADTGVIDGKPTAPGTYGFTIQVSDNSTPTKSNAKHFVVTIAAQ